MRPRSYGAKAEFNPRLHTTVINSHEVMNGYLY